MTLNEFRDRWIDKAKKDVVNVATGKGEKELTPYRVHMDNVSQWIEQYHASLLEEIARRVETVERNAFLNNDKNFDNDECYAYCCACKDIAEIIRGKE